MLGDQAAGEELGSNATATATVRLTDWQEGDTSVTLTSTGGQSYILSIVVGPLTEPEASLELSRTSVDLVEDGEATAVTAAIRYAKATGIEAEAADAGIVTVASSLDAAGTSATIDLTPEGAGTTTVNVTVTLEDESELSGEIAVSVAAAKDPNATIAEGTYGFDREGTYTTDAAIALIPGLDVGSLKRQNESSSHGLIIPNGAQIILNLAGTATVTVQGCTYGDGTKDTFTMESTSGTVTKTMGAGGMSEANSPKFVVEEATGKTTLTFTGSNWVHSIKVEYAQAPTPPVDSANKRINVWDLAGKLETNTALYTNHITPQDLIDASWSDGSGKFLVAKGDLGSVQNKTVVLDGLTFAAGNSDKFYSNIPELASYSVSTTDTKYIGHDFGDGYVSAGGIFTNGGGNASRRNLAIAGVNAGETVMVYVATNQSDTVYTVEELSDISLAVKNGQFDTLSFIAPKAGSYKVRGDNGKPAYLRVAVVPPVTVSGSITLPGDFNATG